MDSAPERSDRSLTGFLGNMNDETARLCVCVRLCLSLIKCVLIMETDLVTMCDFRRILCGVIDNSWVRWKEENLVYFTGFSRQTTLSPLQQESRENLP